MFSNFCKSKSPYLQRYTLNIYVYKAMVMLSVWLCTTWTQETDNRLKNYWLRPLSTEYNCSIYLSWSYIRGWYHLVTWYVSNLTLHRDLQIPFITEEIKKYSTTYHSRLIQHENNQVTELSNPLHVKRRLRQQWPSDLIVEREEEE
jgi:hypothetical protein